MLAPSLVKQIRALLAEGNWSQRQIARELGASRGTVGAIAAGRRPDHDRPPRAKQERPIRPIGPPERCPGCGGIVYMPCRTCLVRETVARQSISARRQRSAEPEGPLQVDLRQEQRARYEEMRAKRSWE